MPREPTRESYRYAAPKCHRRCFQCFHWAAPFRSMRFETNAVYEGLLPGSWLTPQCGTFR